MSSSLLLVILAYAHILSAMGWLGGGILTAFVIGPSVRKLPAPASVEFNAKVLPKVAKFVQAMIGSTLLFGILLLYVYFGGNLSSFPATLQGMELSAGIGLALAAAIIAWGVTMPAFKKVSDISSQLLLGEQQAPPPDMMKYGRRASIGSTVGVALLLVVLAAMVAAGF